MCDVIFSDVAQPDQTEIVMKNADHFLKEGGQVLIAIKVTHFIFTQNRECQYFLYHTLCSFFAKFLYRDFQGGHFKFALLPMNNFVLP